MHGLLRIVTNVARIPHREKVHIEYRPVGLLAPAHHASVTGAFTCARFPGVSAQSAETSIWGTTTERLHGVLIITTNHNLAFISLVTKTSLTTVYCTTPAHLSFFITAPLPNSASCRTIQCVNNDDSDNGFRPPIAVESLSRASHIPHPASQSQPVECVLGRSCTGTRK